MRYVAILLAVVGCSSSAKREAAEPGDPERAAAEARRQKLAAMEPPSPYALRDRSVYRPADRCGQGPYRIESEALAATYGERLRVYACGKHAIKGNVRLTSSQTWRKPDESAFGFERDNAACKSRATAATSGGVAGGSGGGGGVAAGATGPTASSSTAIAAVMLARTTEVLVDCVRSGIIDTRYTTADGIAVEGRFTIDIWSEEPNDLEGLVFVVERSGVDPGMTSEGWRAYQEASAAYHRAYMANLDVEVRAGRTTILDDTVKAPPPPPARAETPPPRPSRNARWIPGYWHYEDAKFHWIVGLWEVPVEDVQRELTVEAPMPPPAAPPRADRPSEPSPTRTAVWTPGSWQWDGRGYLWVAGAWRIPPGADHSWQRATWTVRTGKAVFVPGGWRIGVRLR